MNEVVVKRVLDLLQNLVDDGAFKHPYTDPYTETHSTLCCDCGVTLWTDDKRDTVEPHSSNCQAEEVVRLLRELDLR